MVGRMRNRRPLSEDGTLVATRIWASSQFNNVWLSPEGHVLHVNTGTNVVTVEDESGQPRDVVVDANTQFFAASPGAPRGCHADRHWNDVPR